MGALISHKDVRYDRGISWQVQSDRLVLCVLVVHVDMIKEYCPVEDKPGLQCRSWDVGYLPRVKGGKERRYSFSTPMFVPNFLHDHRGRGGRVDIRMRESFGIYPVLQV